MLLLYDAAIQQRRGVGDAGSIALWCRGLCRHLMASPPGLTSRLAHALAANLRWSSRAADESADVKEFEGHSKVVWMMRY